MWTNMKDRCYNQNASGYEYYGGAGVTMCDEWLECFGCFECWAIRNGYREGLSIDKDILCDKLGIYPKIYSPDTCMFISKAENSSYANTRTNHNRKSTKVFQLDLANYFATTTQTLRNWRNGTIEHQRRYDALYEYYVSTINKEEE